MPEGRKARTPFVLELPAESTTSMTSIAIG